MIVIATCSCGAEYTEASWAEQRFVGVQAFEDDGPARLELRDCSACKSTLGIWRDISGRVCDESGAPLSTQRGAPPPPLGRDELASGPQSPGASSETEEVCAVLAWTERKTS